MLAKEITDRDCYLAVHTLVELDTSRDKALTVMKQFPYVGEVWRRFSSPHLCVPFLIQIEYLGSASPVSPTPSTPVMNDVPTHSINWRVLVSA